MGTEAVAVIEPHDGREDGLRRELPCVLDIEIGLFEIRFADEETVPALVKALSIVLPVPLDVFILLVGVSPGTQDAVIA
jgi:hypothetical protein